MFSTLKDFQVEATYSQRGVDVFDPETGKVSTTTVSTKIKGIALNYQEFVASDKVGEKSDIAFVYQTSKYSLIPDTLNKVILEGKTYAIVTMEQDPAKATWSLQLRAS